MSPYVDKSGPLEKCRQGGLIVQVFVVMDVIDHVPEAPDQRLGPGDHPDIDRLERPPGHPRHHAVQSRVTERLQDAALHHFQTIGHQDPANATWFEDTMHLVQKPLPAFDMKMLQRVAAVDCISLVIRKRQPPAQIGHHDVRIPWGFRDIGGSEPRGSEQ